MKPCALFDLDHTLLGHDCQALFANFVLTKQPKRRKHLFAFGLQIPLRALGIIDTTTLKAHFHRYLAGLSLNELDELSEQFVKEEVLPRIYPELKAEINRHKSEGRTTVLVSASPAFYVKKIASALDFDLALGTEFEMIEPWPLKPQILGGNNKREAKITNLKKARVIPEHWKLETQGTLANSWAYSDSDADLPILEAVANPVCVHPNSSLQEIAKKRNWQILHPQAETGANSKLSSIKQALGIFPLCE